MKKLIRKKLILFLLVISCVNLINMNSYNSVNNAEIIILSEEFPFED